MPTSDRSHILSFLDHLGFQKRYSPHTIRAYRDDLEGFFDYMDQQFDGPLLAEINASFVRSWLADLKDSGLESRSLNRKISSLRSFFKYQLRQGLLVISPMGAITSPKIKKRLPQFVAEKDMNDLFRYVEFPSGWEGSTHRLILELFYHTGIRQSELANLLESQVDRHNCSVKVLGKGNKERILPISRPLQDSLLAYIDAKRKDLGEFDEKILLVNPKGKRLYARYIYNVVNKYLSAVTTIDQKSPHILRHSFATHLMNNGAQLNAVKELLGHSSLAATQVYTHNTIDKLKAVHQKAHPRS